MRFLLFGVAVALLATACGQKGPLYLRDNPPANQRPDKERFKPVPYPREQGESK